VHAGRSFYARAEEEEMEEDPARASKDEGESVSVKELQTRKSEQVKSKSKKKSRGEEAPEFAPRTTKDRSAEQGGRRRQVFTVPRDASVVALAGIVFLMFFYLVNSIWMAADIYSNPSIVMMSRTPSGQPLVIDDYREAYTWLRMNSDPDAKIASWWGTSPCAPLIPRTFAIFRILHTCPRMSYSRRQSVRRRR